MSFSFLKSATNWLLIDLYLVDCRKSPDISFIEPLIKFHISSMVLEVKTNWICEFMQRLAIAIDRGCIGSVLQSKQTRKVVSTTKNRMLSNSIEGISCSRRTKSILIMPE